jgi:hypothetical protein
MSIVETITSTRFPRQGSFLGLRVRVCFHYETASAVPGVIVRDDAEEPYETIISLDDGRVVRSKECQYTLAKEK